MSRRGDLEPLAVINDDLFSSAPLAEWWTALSLRGYPVVALLLLVLPTPPFNPLVMTCLKETKKALTGIASSLGGGRGLFRFGLNLNNEGVRSQNQAPISLRVSCSDS